MVRILLFLVAICLNSFSIQAEQTVAFKRDAQGRILVPVTIDENSSDYLQLDTAAGRTAISEVKRHPYHVKPYDGHIRHMASNGFAKVSVGTMENLAVAGINIKRHIVAVYPADYKSVQENDAPVAGVVGFDVFRGQLLQINGEAGHIAYAANSGFLDQGEWGVIPGYPNTNASILTKTSYKGVELTVLFATGYSRSALNLAAFAELYPNQKHRVLPRKITYRRGMENRVRAGGAVTLAGLDIGGWQLDDLEVAVINVPSIRIAGEDNVPLLILGADVLTRSNLVFDYRDFQVWYPRKAEAVASDMK